MKWSTRISDTEFVRRIEQFNGQRRIRFSIVMVVISSGFVGLSWYFFRLVESAPVPLLPDDWQTPFKLGVTIGFIGGKILFMSLFSLFAGLHLHFARRKDDLLVSYYNRLVELGEL